MCGKIGLSASELQVAGDAGSMGLVGAQLIYTVCRSPVQGTIVDRRERIMTKSVDRAYCIKYDIDLISVYT